MNISFSNALGNHEQALNIRVKRAEVLANNLANADTPGFKARDLDFKAILGQQLDNKNNEQTLSMATTNGKHLPVGNLEPANSLFYRTPSQSSIDGNTVDTQVEMAEYMKNTLQFQSSFQFLNGKFKGLRNAIRGE